MQLGGGGDARHGGGEDGILDAADEHGGLAAPARHHALHGAHFHAADAAAPGIERQRRADGTGMGRQGRAKGLQRIKAHRERQGRPLRLGGAQPGCQRRHGPGIQRRDAVVGQPGARVDDGKRAGGGSDSHGLGS